MAAVAPAEVGFSASEVALLFAMLFAYVAIQVLEAMRPSVVALAGSVPLVGSGLRSAVDEAFGAVRGWLYSLMSQSLIAYGHLLDWLNTIWAAIYNTLLEWATTGTTVAFRITTQIIPHEIQQATLHAEALASSAEGRADAYAAGLAGGLGAEIRSLEASLAADLAAARSEALSLFHTAEADAASLEAHAEQVAAQLTAGERAFAVAAISQLEADITAAFTQAQALTAAAEAALRGDLGTVAGQLAHDLQAGVSALEQEIARARSAISAASVGLAAVAIDVAALKALECLKYCSQLASLGQALQGLDVALIFGLYAAYKANPKGTDTFLQQQVGPGLKSLVSQAEGILGH